MAKKKIGIGIVGIGGIGNHHAGTIASNPKSEVVAFCDSNPAALENAGKNYPEARLCKTYASFLKTPGMDAVVIGTPNDTHAKYTIAAANQGLHVLCEKPIAMNPAQADKMVDAIRKKRLIGMTNFSYRWVPSFRLVHDMIKKGKFGKINRIHVKYLQGFLRNPNDPIAWRNNVKISGFGALGDLGSHMIDSARFLTGCNPKRAIGVHSVKVPTKLNPATGKRARVTADTDAQFMVDFGQFTGIFETSQVEPCHGNHLVVSIGGENASCRVYSEDSGGYEIAISKPTDPHTWTTDVPRVEIPKNFKAGGPCAADFVKAIQGKLKDYPSLKDGAIVQKVLGAIDKSTKSNKWEPVK